MSNKIKLPNHIDPDKFQALRRMEQDFLLSLVSGKFTKPELMSRFYIESDRTRVRWKARAIDCIIQAKLASSE
jgi:hypothetical protein